MERVRNVRLCVEAARLRSVAVGWLILAACVPSSTPEPTDGPIIWKQVEIGSSFACALNSAGGVRCWGWPTYGDFEEYYTSPLALIPDDSFSEIALWGNDRFCGVARGDGESAGELVCRGNDDPEAPPDGWPEREPAIAVRRGVGIGCYVRPDRRSVCFGPRLDRAGLAAGDEIGDVSSGGINQCPYALGPDGEVETFGDCGTHLRPVGPFRLIDWQGGRYCGIEPQEGRLRCGSTGLDPGGEPLVDSWDPDLPDWSDVRAVRTDPSFGCAIRRDGALRCFPGNGPPPESSRGDGIFEQPVRGRFLPQDTRFNSVVIGGQDRTLICGVTESGGVWCGPEGGGTGHYSNVPLDLLPPETLFEPPPSEERDD